MLEDFRLKVFMTVADKGSFTLAAKELRISQPAVSQNVSELEKTLGTELFTRMRGRVDLTSTGVIFKGYASRILHWYSVTGEMFGSTGKLVSNRPVRISSDDFAAEYFLPGILCKLHAFNPKLSFNVDAAADEYDLRCACVPHSDELAFEENSFVVKLLPAAAVTCNPAYSRIGGRFAVPAEAGLAAWAPYASLLSLDLRAKAVLISSGLASVVRFLRHSPETIGLLPLEAVPSDLIVLPAVPEGLQLDLKLSASEDFVSDPVYGSFRNLAMEEA